MKGIIIRATVCIIIVSALGSVLKADTLILIDRRQFRGSLTLIADEYIEFRLEKSFNDNEWIKVYKKDLLAIVNDRGKIVYPRDKYDENALNWGKVRLRNKQEARIYLERKKMNRLRQLENEKQEKNRYKVAVLVGGLSGLMLWAFLDGK